MSRWAVVCLLGAILAGLVVGCAERGVPVEPLAVTPPDRELAAEEPGGGAAVGGAGAGEAGPDPLPEDCAVLLGCLAELEEGEALAAAEALYGGAGSCWSEDEEAVCAEACFEETRSRHAALPQVAACWPWDGSPDAQVILGGSPVWELAGRDPCLGVEDSRVWLAVSAAEPGRDLALTGRWSEAPGEAALGEGLHCRLDGLRFRCEPVFHEASEVESSLHGEVWADLAGMDLDWELWWGDESESCAFSGERP